MAREIRTTLVLDGEAKFKQGLQSLDSELRVMSAQMRALTSQYSENAGTLSNLSQVNNAMNEQVTIQKNKVTALEGAVADSTAAYNQAVQKAQEMADTYGENSEQAIAAANAVGRAERAMDGYKIKLSNAQVALDRSTASLSEFTDRNRNLLALENNMSRLREATRNFADNNPAIQRMSSSFERVRDAAAQVGERIRNSFVGRTFTAAQDKISAVKGAFELAGQKAAEIKEKLQPVLNVTNKIVVASAKITFSAAKEGASALTSTIGATVKGFTAYTGAVTGLGTALFSTIENTREYRNDLAKLEQGAVTSGNSFDSMKSQLVNITALTGESDSSVEALSNLMSAGFNDSQIASAVDSLSGAVIKFPDTLKIESLSDSLQETIATGSATGQFSELIGRCGGNLDDFNAGLANCTTTTERQTYALQWLSKSGLAEVNAEYQKSHKALLDYEKAEQAVTDANAKIAESVMPLAATFKSGYAGILSSLADVISGSDATGTAFQANITQFVNNIAATVTQFAPVLMTAVNSIIIAVATNLPTMISTILPVLIQGFTNLVLGLVPLMPTLLPNILMGAVTLFQGLIDGLNQVATMLLPMLPGLINQLVSILIENIPLLLQGALTLFTAMIQGLGLMIEQLIPMLPTLIMDICNTLIANINLIIDAGFQVLIGLINGITEAMPTLMEKIPEIINKLVGAICDNLPLLIQAGIELVLALVKGLPQAIPELIEAIPELVDAIITTLLETDWLDVGVQLIKGIAQGLIAGVAAIGDVIAEVGESIVSGFKDFFGIASPSKVFKKRIGVYLAQGIGVGFEDEMKNVSLDMENAIPTSFDAAVNAIADNVSVLGGSTNNYNSSPTIIINMDKVQLDSQANMEYTAQQLAFMTAQELAAVGGKKK